MADERQVRKHPSSILRVSFEHPASGERALVAAWDASLGGMFLETIAPLEVGALIVLELQTPHTKVSADARVLWTRAASGGPDKPPGMAVSLIDLPEDVSAALVRALLTGLPEERTILGVGGATKDVTHPGGIQAPTPAAGAPPPRPAPAAGKPAPPPPPKPTPRETQIGVAPQANQPKSKPGAPVPAPAGPVAPVAPSKELDASILAKEITRAPEPVVPRLILEPSEPELRAAAPPPPPSPAESPKKQIEPPAEREAQPRPRAAAASDVSSRDSLEPIPKSGVGGRLLLLLVLAGGGAAAYVYREPIAEMLLPPPAPTPTPTPTPTTTTAPPAESLSATPPKLDDVIDAMSVDAAALIASDAASTDAAREAGAQDAGARDGGVRDAGARDAGRADAGRAATKPDAGHHKP